MVWLLSDRLGPAPYSGLPTPLERVEPFLDREARGSGGPAFRPWRRRSSRGVDLSPQSSHHVAMEATDLTRRMGDFYLVASEVLRDVGDITEQQISHWIVSPFLVSLGWDPHDKKQVYLDYPVKPEGHVDYALLDGEGHPRLIVEVREALEADHDGCR